MGTLREDVLYSSSHSDPDYTSSSEQSCDTVIYIGANGQSLSDRELTDNEGPPRHMPRTNPRVPRRPSGSRSSGEDSDSGRSVRSVRSVESGRLPVRRLMSASPTPGSSGTPPGLIKVGPQSMPGSPKPGLVKLAQRMGAQQAKLVGSDGSSLSVASSSGDGRPTKIHCHSSQSKLAKAIHEKTEPMPGEQWIDGPGAAIYPDPAHSEMWVDGPQAFVVQQQPGPPHPTSSSSTSAAPQQQHHHRADSEPPSTSALPSSTPHHHHHHHHHRSDSTSSWGRAAPKKVNAEEHWVDGPREMLAAGSAVPTQPMHTTCKAAEPARDSSKLALHQSLKPVMSTGVSEKALKQALSKHIKERPESLQSRDSDSSLAVEAAQSRPVSFTSSEDQQGNGSSTCEGRKPRLSDQQKKLDSPGSPRAARRADKPEASHVPRLQKSHLPLSSSPTHRVAQWIKSVSSDQGEGQAGVITVQPGQNEEPAMADAETNTEHDSDFERMAEENGVRSSGSEESPGHSPPSAGAATLMAGGAATSETKCNNVTMDTSLDSSFDTSMTMNAESIYEMEVEERLDFMKTKDGSRLAADVDNETFSSQSCSTRDPDEGERDPHNSEIESLLVEHTKALTESRQTAHIHRHLARAGRGSVGREAPPEFSDHDNSGKREVYRPLLSRKPDGASNPNLSKLCFEEEGQQPKQQHFYHTPMEAMFITTASSGTNILPPSSGGKDLDSFLCDNDNIGVDEEAGGGEGLAKLAAKDKPPLPSTPRQQHQSSLPRSCGPNNNNSSRSIYCQAKPLQYSSSKEPVTSSPSPSTGSGKLSSPRVKNKFIRGGEKSVGLPSCSSSSGISHSSPVSSATSSPIVSSSAASKSSSSSPAALKTPGKCLALNPGPASKFSTFSSRTSSPSFKDKGRKKDKEKDGSKCVAVRSLQLASHGTHKGRGNDSDSGNDSGIVAHEQRLLSPYATVTKPRTQSHSSSGHGSDNR